MLNVKDYPGCISVETMRAHFEGMVKGTPAFAANTPLGAIKVNDRFSHYADPDTDTMWLGFAMEGWPGTVRNPRKSDATL